MKAKIHPQWYEDAVVTCTCSHTFTTGSTKKDIHVDICSACHPLFTGEARYVDTLGRVDRFEKMRRTAQDQAGRKKAKTSSAAAVEDRPQTLKEMIEREQQKSVASN